MSNTTIVKVEKNRYVAQPVFQWDRNQILKIYGLSLASIPEIHFANSDMGHAIVKQASMDNAGVITVDIPNSLLQKPYKINIFVCTYEGGTFQSQYHLELQVKARPRPLDYTLEVTDDEVYSFNALENQVANALAETNAKYDSVMTGVNAKCDSVVAETNAKYDLVVEETNTKYDSAIERMNELRELGPVFMRVDAIRSNGPITGLGDDSYASISLYCLEVDATLNGKYVGKRRIANKIDLSFWVATDGATLPQYINGLKFDISSLDTDNIFYALGKRAVTCVGILNDGNFTSAMRYGTLNMDDSQGVLSVDIVLNDAIENLAGSMSVAFYM